MNDLKMRLDAIEEARQHALESGALGSDAAWARDMLISEAVLEFMRESADASYEYNDAVRTIEDALTAAERGATASQLLECFEHGHGCRDRLQFSRALDFVLGHAAVAELEIDGVETYVRMDTEFFLEGIEPVAHGSQAYCTKGCDADER
ncbi:MAG: hypothetical protein F4237_12505 [Gemmatimonadetes bacterium]|nr:hypothetical protein [Gemmatimonadota bacterium]